MPRAKRGSTILSKSQRRLASIKSIHPTLSLGEDLSVEVFSALAADTQQKLEAYNTLLSNVDQAYLALKASEQALAECSERMLLGVAVKYGKSSEEYVMAGGSQRKTTRRIAKTPTPSPIVPTIALNGKTATVT